MGEPQYLTYPTLSLGQTVFTLASPFAPQTVKQNSLETLQNAIRDQKMAPLYHYLANPISGKVNAGGESGSAVMSPVLSRTNTLGQQQLNSSMSGTGVPDQAHILRRTSSINSPSIVGVLGGNTDTTVELPWDEKLYEELKASNEEELATIQKEEEEAEERAGETEVQSARGKRAEFYARIGDKEKAIEEFEKLFDKTGILGTKIDIVLAIIRLGLFFDDKLLVKKHIDRASALVESGGDWDRRNRLKAYQGIHLLTIRAHAQAAPLLLDSLSTFTSTELCPYSSLVVYATLAGSVALQRKDFKQKVVDAPEIRAVFGTEANSNTLSALTDTSPEEMDAESTNGSSAVPKAGAAVNLTTLASGSATAEAQAQAEPQIDFRPLATMIQSLYTGTYTSFFTALASVEQNFLSQDRYLYEHKSWFVREMRLRAYSQLLQSYKIVSLESMAKSFGVSVDWLDKDLAPFIAGQRLLCVIDRVRGVIETQRSDDKNKQYHDVVRQGDGLITKLQKYGQVVRLRGSERS